MIAIVAKHSQEERRTTSDDVKKQIEDLRSTCQNLFRTVQGFEEQLEDIREVMKKDMPAAPPPTSEQWRIRNEKEELNPI